MLGAAKAPQSGTDLQPPARPEIHMPPDRIVILLALPVRRRVGALRALQLLAAQGDPDHHPVGLEADLLDPHPGQVQQAGECGSDAHGRRPPSSDYAQAANLRSEPVRVAPQARKHRQTPLPSTGRFRRHRCRRATTSRSHPAPPQAPAGTASAVARDLQNPAHQYKAPAQPLNRHPSHLRSSTEPRKKQLPS
jgi:hypothetical protein